MSDMDYNVFFDVPLKLHGWTTDPALGKAFSA